MTPEQKARAQALVVSIRKQVDEQNALMRKVAEQVDALLAENAALKAEVALLRRRLGEEA